MNITILTLFPRMFDGPFSESIIRKAQDKHAVTINYVNIRDFSTDRYRSVDDHPYGGGLGMILKVDVIDRALKSVAGKTPKKNTRIILLDPQGVPYTQKKAKALTTAKHLILICGHYEGVDERVRSLVDEEISIGDYVLTGGELPAMVIIDSVVRLLPGVLASKESADLESFSPHGAYLEYPQYTRPPVYKRMRVPPVLLSGNHAEIEAWRSQQAKNTARSKRPDLKRR